MQAEESEIEMTPVVASSLLEASYNAMKHMSANKGQKIEFINNCKNEAVMANRNGIVRMINNLLSNAVKFTPEGGNVTLALDPAPQDHLTITVADTGIGIPEDNIPRLFDKFTKTSQSGTGGEKGTGLGMSIVKEIVDIHGGTIDVSSKEGEGTRFEIKLPITPETPVEKPPEADM